MSNTEMNAPKPGGQEMNTVAQSCIAAVKREVQEAALRRVPAEYKEELIAAEIMIAARTLGPDVSTITAVLGHANSTVERIADRLRASGLWTETGVDYLEWDLDEYGDNNFTADLCVAQGVLVRAAENDGHLVYRPLLLQPGSTDLADTSGKRMPGNESQPRPPEK